MEARQAAGRASVVGSPNPDSFRGFLPSTSGFSTYMELAARAAIPAVPLAIAVGDGTPVSCFFCVGRVDCSAARTDYDAERMCDMFFPDQRGRMGVLLPRLPVIRHPRQRVGRSRRAYGAAEYSPPGLQYRFVLPDVPGNCVVSGLNDLADISGKAGDGYSPVRPGSESLCQGTFTEAPDMAEYKKFTGVADHAGYLILRLRSYPAWTATLNGNPTSTLMERGHGLMAVAVTRGPVVVIVKWRATADVIIGRWLSALALTLLTALYLLEQKLSRLVYPDGTAHQGEVSVEGQTGSNAPTGGRNDCREPSRISRKLKKDRKRRTSGPARR